MQFIDEFIRLGHMEVVDLTRIGLVDRLIKRQLMGRGKQRNKKRT